jgi:hypothetical protein
MAQPFLKIFAWVVHVEDGDSLCLYGMPFIDDYERRRRDLLKRIELMEAHLPHTGKPELERWITTTADSLEQAKADLAEIEAEIERLLEEAKAKVRAGD